MNELIAFLQFAESGTAGICKWHPRPGEFETTIDFEFFEERISGSSQTLSPPDRTTSITCEKTPPTVRCCLGCVVINIQPLVRDICHVSTAECNELIVRNCSALYPEPPLSLH